MKRAAIVFIAVLLMLTGAAFAADRDASIEGFAGIGTEPANEFGTGFGLGVGLNVPFNSVFQVSNPRGTKDLMLRADVSYFFWEEDILGIDFEFTRIPLFLGARYFIPTDKIRASGLGIFGEAGIELSFDEFDVPTPLGTVSDDEVNFGIPVGFGIQYYVSEGAYFGLSGRLHLISDSYFNLVATVGFDL